MTLTPMTNLAAIAQTGGVKYFNLAFITADTSGQPSWGGYLPYEVNGGAFDQQIRADQRAPRPGRRRRGLVRRRRGAGTGPGHHERPGAGQCLPDGRHRLRFDPDRLRHRRRGRGRSRLDRPPLAGHCRVASQSRGAGEDTPGDIHAACPALGPDGRRPLRASVRPEVRREDHDRERDGDGLRRQRRAQSLGPDGHLRDRRGDIGLRPVADALRRRRCRRPSSG